MLDIFISFFGLLLLSPLLIVVMVLIRMTIGSPVFFTQWRPGKNGKLFRLYKFRTMTNEKDIKGDLLPNARRLTRLGSFLRSTSLDELPELWNVIRGEMSLVGPRPLKTDYLELYSEEQKRRHEVRPGITGWAQVNGRNQVSFTRRFEMDVWYVDNRSLWLDFKILGMTAIKVFRREDVDPENSKQKKPFDGSN